MSILRIERNPTRRQLRQFGVVGAALLFILAWWQSATASAIALAAVGALVLGCAVWSPGRLRRPFVWLSIVLYPIGFIVGELVLAGVYFLVFTPIAVCFRLVRRDALNRSWDATCESYWQDSPQPESVHTYYRQY